MQSTSALILVKKFVPMASHSVPVKMVSITLRFRLVLYRRPLPPSTCSTSISGYPTYSSPVSASQKSAQFTSNSLPFCLACPHTPALQATLPRSKQSKYQRSLYHTSYEQAGSTMVGQVCVTSTFFRGMGLITRRGYT